MFQLLGAAYLAVFTIPLVVIDHRERRLPNKITLPAISVTLLGLFLAGDWTRAGLAMLYAGVLFGFGTFLSIKGWLGMGDVKLLVPIALTLGWYGLSELAIGLAVAFFAAGLYVLARLVLKTITVTSTIALGPYLLLGFWVGVGQKLLITIS